MLHPKIYPLDFGLCFIINIILHCIHILWWDQSTLVIKLSSTLEGWLHWQVAQVEPYYLNLWIFQSSKVIAYLKIFYPSLWIIRGLKFKIDYKKNHSFDSPVKIRVLFDQGYWSMYKSWFGSYNISLVFEKSLYKKLVKVSRGCEVLKMIHQPPKILTKLGFGPSWSN